MKPIYKSLLIEAAILSVSLSLQAQVISGETVATQDVQAENLEGLKVVLISPNVSGAKDLIASGECVLDGANISIDLQNLAQGIHRVQVSAVFGTQTCVIYALDLTVPAGALASDPQEYEDTVTVVSTYGDGDVSGADASVYAKDGEGNAHITKPLSIGDGEAGGAGAVASGSVNGDGSHISANSDGAVASGVIDGENASIQATGAGAIASGCAYGDGASIQATSDGAVASGYANGENASIRATSDGAVASGNVGENASIQANGAGAIASGCAYGDGASIQATSDGAIASGYVGENSSIQATSEGAIASGCASDGASIQADSSGTIASGVADSAYGNVSAAGTGSQAFGLGTQTQTDGQMVLGKCNVVDENGDYAFIVGNGTADDARSNAFAIDWNGNLVLFNAGTPVVLTPAKLATLIA